MVSLLQFYEKSKKKEGSMHNFKILFDSGTMKAGRRLNLYFSLAMFGTITGYFGCFCFFCFLKRGIRHYLEIR